MITTRATSTWATLVWALTRRIGLSLVLIAMIVIGHKLGWIHLHGVGQ